MLCPDFGEGLQRHVHALVCIELFRKRESDKWIGRFG
ncbi:hypothetical protein HRbin26_00742 [bacterium HR26]|nr:hypothetical protein HRbin26_00742 [bacterium HR26]